MRRQPQPAHGGDAAGRIDPEALWARANAAITQHDHHSAAVLLNQLLKLQPRRLEALRSLASLHQQAGNIKSAVRLLRRAVGASPRDATIHRDLALHLADLGDFTGAIRSHERAADLDPDDEANLAGLALSFERTRRPDDARRVCRRAIEVNPQAAAAMCQLARVDLADGRLDEAQTWATKASEIRKDSWNQIDALHLLGAINERRQLWDEAFAAHERANAFKLARDEVRKVLAKPFLRELCFWVRDDAADFYRRWADQSFDDGLPDPLFLVGFPRSGTTMTEQVLGAVPGVFTTDEHPLTQALTSQLEAWYADDLTEDGALEVLDALTPDQVTHLRRLYWKAAWHACGDEAKGKLVVDKFPFRFLEAAILNRLFPASRIIFVVRDPRDCCLSGFFQNFAVNAAMAHFLTLEMAGDLYADTIGFWLDLRHRITLPYLEIRYEDLVSDFEPNARRLVEFIGKPWSDEVLRFHEKAARRAIRTPSAVAVGQKINTRAIGKWAHYERLLGPLLPRVEPFLDLWGYEP